MSPMEYDLRIGLEGYELLRIQEAKELQLHVQLKDELEPKQCLRSLQAPQ